MVASPFATAQAVLREVFPSGLTLIVNEFHNTPAVEVRVSVRAGTLYEGTLLGSGVSALLQRLLVNSGAEETSRILAELGNQFQATTSVVATNYSVTTTGDKTGDALALLAGMVAFYSYNQLDLQRERQALVAGRSGNALQSEDALLNSLLYREHPARLPVAGLPRMTEQLTVDLVKRYQMSRYVAGNTVVLIVGNVNTNDARKWVEQAFSKYPIGGFQPTPLALEPPQFGPRYASGQISTPTPRVTLAWRTESAEHASQPALAVLAQLFGDAQTGLARKALASQQVNGGVVVDCRAPVGQPGYFSISFETPIDKRADAERALRGTIEALAKDGPEAAALAAAKLRLRFDLAHRQTNVRLIADDLLQWELATGEPTYGRKFVEQVDAVTADDVVRVCRKYLIPDGINRTCTIVLKPSAEVIASSSKLAEPTGTLEPDVLTLGDGVTALLRPAQEEPLAHVRVSMGGGAGSEDAAMSGATALLADLMTRATEQRSPAQVAAILDGTGMQLNAAANCHALSIGATCFPEQVAVAIDLLVDMAAHPALAQEDLDAVRARALRKAERIANTWDANLLANVREIALKGHYAERDPNGSKATLTNLDRAAVASQYRKLSVSKNVVVSVYGQFDQQAVGDQLRKLFAKQIFAAGEPVRAQGAKPAAVPPPPISVGYTDDAFVALAMAWPAPALTDRAADEAPMEVLGSLLAGVGASGGRINRALAGIGHDLKMNNAHEAYDQRGLWVIWGQLDELFLDLVQQGIHDQVRALIEQLSLPEGDPKALSDAELVAAQAMCVTAYTLKLEDQAATAAMHAETVLTGGHVALDVDYPRRIAAVTKADLKRVAKAWLAGDPVTVVHTARKSAAPEQPIPPEGEGK